MRINHHEGFLTYCSNIHPGESWQETFENLKLYTPQVKTQLGTDSFGIGLRLSHEASLDLIQPENLSAFKTWLEANGLYVFTINGFPYGQFHFEVVKDKVHAPDWTDPDRLAYTKRLFQILAELLPEGMDGGVSTSPLSYRFWHQNEEALAVAKSGSLQQLCELVALLRELKATTGKSLHLDMEPEPDGVLETTQEFVDYYEQYLLKLGIPQVQKHLACDAVEAEAAIRAHIQLCYDVCHFAVGYEKPEEAINRIESAGIRIGRIQISAALGSPLLNPGNQPKISHKLKAFDEPVYLHQAVIKTKEGSLKRFQDLGDALVSLSPSDLEIRTHFHVPIFTETYDQLVSTQQDIIETLRVWKSRNFTNHLEVETYTWDVLPDDMRTDLVGSIVRELNWVKDTLDQP